MGYSQEPNIYQGTERLIDPGTFIAYNFCGGTGFAFVNSYKWHIPKQYTDNNGTLHSPDPFIVYLCSKLYGTTAAWGAHVGSGHVRDGWEDQDPNHYYSRHPEHRPKEWPEGKQPLYKYSPKYFLPVYQLDVNGVIDFDKDTYDHYGSTYQNINNQWKRVFRTKPKHHRFKYYDKNKLFKDMDVQQSNKPELIEYAKKQMDNFEKRKAQVLLRKLQS